MSAAPSRACENIAPIVWNRSGAARRAIGQAYRRWCLVEFASEVDAATAMIEFQQAMADVNKGQPQDAAILFRIGLPLGGDLIVARQAFRCGGTRRLAGGDTIGRRAFWSIAVAAIDAPLALPDPLWDAPHLSLSLNNRDFGFAESSSSFRVSKVPRSCGTTSRYPGSSKSAQQHMRQKARPNE